MTSGCLKNRGVDRAKRIALIPAAGVGSRFGALLPKQYVHIAGQSVLQHTINRFARHDRIAHIAVIVSPDDMLYRQHIALPNRAAVYPVGGQTRAQTVRNGLAFLLEHGLAMPEDWICVHDAARCCLPESALNRLLAADCPDGALLAIPVADTLKYGDSQHRVAQTLSRDGVWQAQTPQIFRAEILQGALARAHEVTDEASAVEALGLRPLLVEGDVRNFKLTRPEDVKLAELLLRAV